MAELVLAVPSRALGRQVEVTVVLPDPPEADLPRVAPAGSRPAEGVPAAAPSDECLSAAPRVCYLLHGITGNHRTWVQNVALWRAANRLNMAFVCPSLERSFGLNWASGYAWDEFLTHELPGLISRYVRCDFTPGSAAIAGISMGGYAAYHAALTHPTQYAAAGSFSGVLDIASDYNRPRRWELYRGAFAVEDVSGTDVDLLALLRARVEAGVGLPRLWVTCGSDDHVFAQSVRFRDVAGSLNAAVSYRQRPGDHDWTFWSPAWEDFCNWLAHPSRTARE